MKSKGSKKNRLAALLAYGHLYEFESFGNRMVCAYCGDVRESIDHIPPLAVVGLVGTDQLRERGVKFKTVPCCKACNSVLGAKMLGSYDERLGFVYRRLLDKAEKAPYWTETEIQDAELKGSLRDMVAARSAHVRREILFRLRGMEANIAAINERMEVLGF